MNESMPERAAEREIDLQKLFSALWHKIWLMILLAVLFCALAFGWTYYFVTPLYQSSALFYVNNSSVNVGDASLSISSGDISAAQKLVDSYIVILKSRTTLGEVIDYAGVNRSYSEVRGMISAKAVNSTEIFEVVVTSDDPLEAENIANSITKILPKRISNIIEGTSAKIVDTAIAASAPSSPSYSRNCILGAVIGILISAAIVVIRFLTDVTIRSEEDIAQVSKSPVLAAIPDMTAPSKGGYYGYGAAKAGANVPGKQNQIIGKDISFAAAEAYKLLRTKLQFSFTDEKSCHVIGITSSLSTEGKSVTAANLAYSLSQLNKRVLLMDCDMRRPSLPLKLPIHKTPGLSGYLTNQNTLEELFQPCGLKGEEDAFTIISSGRNPPNPVELLSSHRMEKTVEELREKFDFIILDLPPIGEVSDAIAVTKIIDGTLLVVRHNLCNRPLLDSTVRQLAFVDARILGVVYNGVNPESKQGYYKKYYKYTNKYEGAYASDGKSPRRKSKKQSGKKAKDSQ